MVGATDKRRQAVLRAIVADYIASQEPVGSKALLERHQLQVSSATIRNDMAVLESEGLIAQQHASSGRIPTEKGYRVFVDSISEIKPLSRPERRAIAKFLEDGVDLEDVLRRSAQLLSQLTHQAAMVQLPNLKVSRVKHCEIVQLSPRRLLLVLITDNGRVEQRNVELMTPVAEDDVVVLRDVFNNVLEGKTLRNAQISLESLTEVTPPGLRHAVEATATVLVETLVEKPNDRMILAGAANLTRMARDGGLNITEMLDALEEQVVVLRLLTNVPDLGNVSVLIGEENDTEELHGTSVVTSAYGAGDTTLGGLGVLGPTYMDYTGTIAKVAAVSSYVSRILGAQ